MDHWGVPVQGGDESAVALLDQAIEDLVLLSGSPVATAEAAVAAGDLVLGRIYLAYLSLYATTPEGVTSAKMQLEELTGAGDGAGLAQREALHLAAATSWAEGDLAGATKALEQALVLNPNDLLALKVAQDLYFFLGDVVELRDVVRRVLPSWPKDRPGWGYVSGMYAFGLEENGAYRDAESHARSAVGESPRDVWATHALAHVFEMEGRQRQGIAFLESSATHWRESFFAIHNWWHCALYHLELLETEQVLALYDETIRAGRSVEWLDLVDAASLLWRLCLFGVDVSERAELLAADLALVVAKPIYIFNDWHATMAFGLSGHHGRNRMLLEHNRRGLVGTNKVAAARAGLGLLEGFGAFAEGDYERSLDLLIAAEPRAQAVGGSHAQRDVIELTMIAAAWRAGEDSVARSLMAKRVERKPASRIAAQELSAVNSRRASAHLAGA